MARFDDRISRIRRPRFVVVVLTTIVLCPASTRGEKADIPDRPPPLTFDKHVDYIAWYNDFVRRGRDEKDNAYPLYLKLCPDADGNGGIRPPEGPAAAQIEKTLRGVWSAEEYRELAAYLRESESLIDEVMASATAPGYWQPLPPRFRLIDDIQMPVVHAGRNAAKALLAMATKGGVDQPGLMGRAVERTLRLADHMQQGPMMMSVLTGCAERGMTYGVIRAMLAEGRLSPSNIKSLYDIVAQRGETVADDLHRTYCVEWATWLDYLQYVCPGGRVDDGRWRDLVEHMRDMARIRGDAAETVALADFDPQEAASIFDECSRAQAKVFRGPLERVGVARLQRVEDQCRERFEQNAYTHLLKGRFSVSYSIILRSETNRRGTLLSLALHAHRLRTGRWPQDLSELDLVGNKVLLHDPLADAGFVYRVRGDAPLLYSVGVDGKDDGGIHHRKFGDGTDEPADYVFWPYPERSNDEQGESANKKPSG